jgi:hypothetical protein
MPRANRIAELGDGIVGHAWIAFVIM